MDAIDFWERQVTKWNAEAKCGLCWAFGAPLRDAAVETYQIREESKCCVQVFYVNPSISTARTYNDQTGLITDIKCNRSFELIFVMPSRIDINNYNEIIGHGTEESKWATILNRLEQCIACDAELDFCEIIGTSSRITNWSARLLPANYTSNNYEGYRLSVSFQDVR